jgi:tetratricopeptide (TPR) repeat protein
VKRLAEEVFGLVSQAYEALSTTSARQEYRQERARGARLDQDLDEARRAVAAEREYVKGEAALRERSYARAFEAFRKAVELYPGEGEYLANLAWARFLSAPDDATARSEAVRGLKRAAKLAPDSEKPYLLLGQLYKATGEAESSERMFMRALQQKSDCVEALRELRLINLRREKQRGLVRKFLRR